MLEGAQWVLKTYTPKLAICTYHLPDDKKVLTNLILKANPFIKLLIKGKNCILKKVINNKILV